jgi:hypothetical protein
MAVYEDPMTRGILAMDLVGDLGRPGLHIFDFGRLEIIIDGHTILKRDTLMKRHLLRTVEDRRDAVRAEPVRVQRHAPVADPQTRNNLVGVNFGCVSAEGRSRHYFPHGI